MDCSFQPEITLDVWVDNLLNPLQGKRYPISGSIELTERCNLACVHCYINQPAGDTLARSHELSTSQVKEVFDQMAEAGCLFLLLTGGEPLLRDDFAEIFVHARERGMLVSLFSNGTMLTDGMAELLFQKSLHSLEVTLYGATRETYEAVTGQPGSFDRCLRGIEIALSHGLKLNLKSVLLTRNQHELEQMRALTNSFGLKFRYDSSLWPRLDGSMQNLQYQISRENILALDMADPQRREGWLETAEQFKGQLLRVDKVFNCGAGYRSFHVSASGKMSPCMMVRRPSFDILQVGFDQAWNDMGIIRSMKRELNTACETCTVAALCTQCPGWSLAVHDDFETPVSDVCELGKSRASMFINIEI